VALNERNYFRIDPLSEPVPADWRGGVLSFGNFDGVHRGHAAILATARRLATELNSRVVAVTFDPAPAALLRPQHPFPPLTTIPERAALLRAAGADHVVVFRTSRNLLDLSPAEFYEQVIVRSFAALGVVEGISFRFGKDRAGTDETLRQFGELWGIATVTCVPILHRGRPVSSSRIRAAVQKGDVREAAAMLGRAYAIEGAVVSGAGRGRELGFPTANLAEIATLVPASGVYAGRAGTGPAATHPAAIHVGAALTFGEETAAVEVHLIGFSGDLTGERLRVEFFERLRDSRRFDSADALRRQLEEDVREASRIVADWRCPDLVASPTEETAA